MKLANSRLQFITHYTEKYSYTDSARIALEGGCRWIQLRMKEADEAVREETALVVQQMCKDYDATFIIDDQVELARKIKADGVHLGKNDMPPAEARSILGDSFIIGSTVNAWEDVQAIMKQATPDYFGCGPFRFTTTKTNLAPILGLEGYRNIIREMREAGIHLPMVAIGGIRKEDIPGILATGVHGIALSSSMLRAENPVAAMKEIVHVLNSNP